MNIAVVIRRLALAGVLLGLVVVVLGAWVRLTDAGLGCPDWPTCYGHVTPAGAAANADLQAQMPSGVFNSGKAWREMIHRYAATSLGLIIVLIAVMAIVYRRQRWVRPGFAIGLLATVLFQGALGAFTVWWLVKPLVVTSHLLGGLTTVALLYWLWLGLRRSTGVVAVTAGSARTAQLGRARGLAALTLIAIVCQIALGGWTSSNYAATACPDLPTCQAQWWPADMDYDNAFVLWRGLNVNYTGGVLEHAARVAIHFTHRLGAVALTIVLLTTAWFTLRNAATNLVRNGGYWLLAALGVQLLIGVLMVWRGFPLALATAHNAGAALLLVAALTLNRRLRD